MLPRISVQWLAVQGACSEQVALFREHFGEGEHDITRAGLARAATLGLDINWLAYRVLPAPLSAEYERQRAPLLAEYKHQHVPLLAEYERQHVPLRAEYERQRAPLLAEYERQHVPLRAEYERQRASLLADLLNLSKGA